MTLFPALMSWLHFTGLPGSTVDALGFVRPEEPQPEGYEKFWSKYWPVLVKREKRWQKNGIPSGKKLMRFIRKGIPARLRPNIWLQNCPKLSEEKHPVSADIVDEIRRDLSRTFPDNAIISSEIGKNALGWILFTVAEHLPDIGYCQGFNYIAGLLYIIIGNKAVAAQLMVYHVSLLRTYYDCSMSGIQTDMVILRDILRERGVIPDALLRLIESDLQMIISKWFVCWYLETLPLETVLRVWDCLFSEGESVLFRIAIVLLENSVPLLAKCKNLSDVMTVVHDIGNLPLAIHCHDLLQMAFSKDKTELTTKTIQKRRLSTIL